MSTRRANPAYQEFSIKLLNYMKWQNNPKIFDCLNKLKNNSKCSKIVLQDHDFIQLIKLLRWDSPAIKELSLSILADACRSIEVRREIEETNIVTLALWFTNNLSLKNSFHCKACRLIGNLCQSTNHARSFHKAGVITSLTTLMDKYKKKLGETIIMAVRVFRYLWQNCRESRDEILNNDIISSTLLISFTKKKYTDECLKTIYSFFSTSELSVVKQLYKTYQINYKILVDSCKLNSKAAISCMFVLCQIPDNRPKLGASGAIEAVIALVSKEDTFTSQNLIMLSLFCREAVNRFHVRSNNGLELMLSLLKKIQYAKYKFILLQALVNFITDEESITIMLRNGLVDILVERLKIMAVNSTENNDEQEEEEEENLVHKLCTKSEPNVDILQIMFNNGRYSFDYYSEPRGVINAYCSLNSSMFNAMMTVEENEDDNNTEKNDGPVCNDNEFNKSEEPQKEVKESNTSKADIEKCCNTWTLILLNRLCHVKEPIEKLADPCIITPLLCYIRNANDSKALTILKRIASNSIYLIPLVKQGFIFELQTIYRSECVIQMLQGNLATTGGAIGEFAAILLRGQESHKYITAVSIPFLITAKYTLRNLLNDHGGLPLIFKVLCDDKHHLYEKAVWSACRLAEILKIQPEKFDENDEIYTDEVMEDDQSLFDQETNNRDFLKFETVIFELDDGSTVATCARTLCRNSDVFDAMLRGNFIESGKGKVHIKDTSKESLFALLFALRGASLKDIKIESLMDAVILANKYLMRNISNVLTKFLLSKLSHENYSRAWNWARENFCTEFKIYCIKSLLTTNMTHNERTIAFRDFSNCENFTEFLEDVRIIINSELCQR